MDLGSNAPDILPRLLSLLDEAKADASGQPPLLCLDGDGTLWPGQAGLAFTRWLVDKEVLPAAVLADHRTLLVRDVTKAQAWLTTCLAGLALTELQEYATYFAQRAWPHALRPDLVRLVRAAGERGLDVVVVSSSNRWLVEQLVQPLDLYGEQIVAMEVTCERGVLTDRLVEPAVNGTGKIQALVARGGRPPWMALGNSIHDLPMLEAAQHPVLVVEAGTAPEATPVDLARSLGWLVWPVETKTAQEA